MVKTRITANLVLVALLAALAVSLFADVIFTKEPKIAIPFYSEAFQNIIPFREFCSREMLSGRFPFWNPYLYCGSPVFSNPEMGILYLPNFLYLFFPSCKAFNLNVVFHVFLGAFFMYLWSARRGIKPLGRITASVVFMFGAPQILYASLGAYSNLQTLIWAPLVFMAVDGMVERPAFKWAMAGGLAVMMQIFAGHMQFTYYTGFLAVVYLMIKLCVPGKPILDKFHSAATFVIMYFLASALAAVQLYPGYLWHLGGVRAGGIPYMAAASCSLPPE
ncbi:MAG: hypothetical protein PHT95_06800, partial [Candidatus Omnitrophica bacterium]|nr:hypothetical protein [Candidatus Omnitrophota bacterium]